MASENVVLLTLQLSNTYLMTNDPTLSNGQRVAVTDIVSASNKPQKLGDGAIAYSSLPFIDPVRIETGSTYDLTQSFLAVDSNIVEITNTGSSSISVIGSSETIGVGFTRIFRRVSGSWESTDTVTTIADEVTNTKRPGTDSVIIPHFIGQEYTNLAEDGCDLTTANWTNSNSTDELTDIEINGHKFTKITNSGANSGFVKQVFTDAFTNLILTGQVILRNGDIANNQTKFTVRNTTGAVNIVEIAPDFDNHPNAPANMSKGTLLDYEWIDSETLKMNFECDALANLTDDVELRCYGTNLSAADEYTYWTEVQLIDEAGTTMFPFVDGTHAADVINETFTMPDKFAIDMIIEPKFAFDTSTYHFFYVWYLDSTHKCQLNYDASATDRFYLSWQDGGTVTYLNSSRFDDGTSYININQKLRFIILANLISGGQTDSGLLIIEEDGTVHEYTSWSTANPDVKSSNFPTLKIGNNQAGGAQANSYFGPIPIYSWDGNKPTITSSDDANQYFQDESMIFEAIPDAFIPRVIKVNTPISSALQQITNDIRTGQGIQDKAILNRHLNGHINPRSFTSGRFDSQELTSGTLSVSGWYTIAECDDAAGAVGCEIFGHDYSGGGSLGCEIAISASSTTKEYKNTTIKFTKSSANNLTNPFNQITSWRLAKSDSVLNAGFKIQAFLDPATSRTFEFAIHQNKARVGLKGFSLVTPYLDNTPTLPDGVTTGTFLEAGEELSLNQSVVITEPSILGLVVSVDSIAICVLWPEIPKQGTGLTITLPATSFIFRDYNANAGTVSGSHTISNFSIIGKRVMFYINETNAFSTMTINASAWARIAGGGMKLTIT